MHPLLVLIILNVILYVSFIFFQKNPDFYFWFFFILFFDPGGIFENYLESKLLGFLNASDVFFFLMMTSFISVKNKPRILKNNPAFKKIFVYLIFFALYYLFIYGLIIPIFYSRGNFLFFLQKNRMYFMALPMMYAVYMFSQRSIQVFFKLLVFTSLVFLSLYIFTLVSGIEIIPVFRLERFKGSGIMRNAMLSYGLMNWIFYFGIIIYYIKKKINIDLKIDRKIIYYVAILMAITILLTLTRRELINIIVHPLVIIFLISYLFRISGTNAVFKMIIPVMVVFILIIIIFPNEFNYILETYQDIVFQILPGDNPAANKDYRVMGEGDLLYVMQIIKENIFFGTGAVTMLWKDVIFAKKMGDPFAMALDAGGEMPIYGAFMNFGIVGLILLIPVYYFLIKYVFNFVMYLRQNINIDLKKNIISVIIIIYLISEIIVKFTSNFYSLFGEFYSPSGMVYFCCQLGFLLSLTQNYILNINNLKKNGL